MESEETLNILIDYASVVNNVWLLHNLNKLKNQLNEEANNRSSSKV